LEGAPRSTANLCVAKPEFAGHCARGFMERDSSVAETYRNVLIYAMAMVGNERLLAERLGVNPQQVLDWTNGIEPVPAAIFLKTIDVVVAATPEDIRRSKQVLTNCDLFPSPK
jgi:hypothetical protein